MIARSLRSVPEARVPAVTVSRGGKMSEADAASFQIVRPRLFGIAYRMLGSAAEADDVVQETWIRWQGTDRTEMRDAAAFLATTTTRLAINVLQSARARRGTRDDCNSMLLIVPGVVGAYERKVDTKLACAAPAPR